MSKRLLKCNSALLLCMVLGLVMQVARSEPTSFDRGRLLYENHCLDCHESQVHIRTRHSVRSVGDLYRTVARWSDHLQLRWQPSEMNDVTHYLYRTYYAVKSNEGAETK